MSFYIRKSIRCGPVRFNLSKSGIGLSGGVKGFRIGTGPKGNYVHMGRGGLYYRKYQSSSAQSRSSSGMRPLFDSARPAPSAIPDVQMHEVESASTDRIVDSSSAELISEFAAKRKKISFTPICAWFLIPVTIISPLFAQSASFFIPLLILTSLAVISTAIRDRSAKTVVLMYNLEPDYESSYRELYNAFDELRKAKKVWHVSAKGKTRDAKYHAGANELIQRTQVTVEFKNPPFVKTNIPTPSVPVGKQRLYFFPDRVLVFESKNVGAVSYENLNIQLDEIQFIEIGNVPHDSKVIGKTWQYVNKKGGPDKRFKDNRELPIALYQSMHFGSPTGLNELLYVSRIGIAQAIHECVQKVAQMTPNEMEAPPPEQSAAPPSLLKQRGPFAASVQPIDTPTGIEDSVGCPSCAENVPVSLIVEGMNTCPACGQEFKVAFE